MSHCFDREIRLHPAYVDHVMLAVIDVEDVLKGHPALDGEFSAFREVEVHVAVVTFKEYHPDYQGGRWVVFSDEDDWFGWLDYPIEEGGEPRKEEAHALVKEAARMAANT